MNTHFPKYSIGDLQPWTGDTGPLECINIQTINHNVKSFTFKSVNPAYFDFYPGQHITLILPIFGEQVFRTYTIASSPTTPYYIQITSKFMPHGVVTNWMHNALQIGDQIEAMNIGGTFSPALDKSPRKMLFLSGGSGVTPMISSSLYIYDHGLNWDVVFMHSAQSKEDLIEVDKMHTIEDYVSNFKVLWVTDNGELDNDWHGISGFISQEILAQNVPDFLDREIYCCGPAGYMDNIQNILRDNGFDMNHYHMESFEFGQSSANNQEVDEATPTTLDSDVNIAEVDTSSEYTVTLTKSEKVISVATDAILLDEIKNAGVHAPFACSQGVCGTCRTMKKEGQVDMKHQGGILKKHEDQGYILICCSKAKSDLILDI